MHIGMFEVSLVICLKDFLSEPLFHINIALLITLTEKCQLPSCVYMSSHTLTLDYGVCLISREQSNCICPNTE